MMHSMATAGPRVSTPASTVKAAIRRHWNRKAATFDEGESRVSRSSRIFEAWRAVFRQVGRRP